MHNLLILDDGLLTFIQEPFLTDFIKTYWDKIALAYPVSKNEKSFDTSYFDIINTGHTVDWLFAIVPNPHHPLDIDWIFLKPRQAHPWWYGNHPATSNFNGGGSTACFTETLCLIETLSKDDRVNEYCQHIPELYTDNPPKTFEFLYRSGLFIEAKRLAQSGNPSFDDLHVGDKQDNLNKIHKKLCLGLYGCNDATLNMNWQVESMRSNKSWTFTTVELADKVTLAMRLSGKSDEYINLPPSEAFEQWMGKYEDNNNKRETLLIRTKDDILFCNPQVSEKYNSDAYFLDCEQQKVQRLGGNGGDATPTLREWGLNPNDERLRFLVR
jgi:hypothetical protein